MKRNQSTILHRAALTLVVMACTISAWAQTTHVVNKDNVDNIFSGTGHMLGDAISEGDILDFDGTINIKHSLVISKRVNIISSNHDAVVKLNTAEGNPSFEIHGDPGNSFVINKAGSGSTVQDIRIENTQTWLYNTSNVTFTGVTMWVADARIGTSVGHVSIRYSDNITFIGCTVYTKNNGGTDVCKLTGSSSCTFQNCNFENEGSISNSLYIGNSYTTDDIPADFTMAYDDVSVLNCTFTNNNVVGVESKLKISEGLRHHIEGCTVDIGTVFSSKATNLGEGHIIRNNTFSGGLSVPKYCTAENNTVNGSLSMSGANATVQNNSIKGDVTLGQSNEKFTDNMVLGTLTVSSNSKNNSITGNMIISSDEYAVILKPTAADANNTVQNNILIAAEFAGDDAVNPGTGGGNTISDNKAGNVGNSVTWSYNATLKTLTISGTGDMADYEQTTDGHSSAPWVFMEDEVERLVISEGVTRIGNNAFVGCSKVTTIISNSMTPPTLGSNAFCKHPPYGDYYFYVPVGTTTDYETAWDSYRAYVYEYYACGPAGHENDVMALYDSWTKIMTICGKGAMADYSSADDQPWKALRDELQSVYIESSITHIGAYAFDHFRLLVSIDGKITRGSNAFAEDACWIYVPLDYLDYYMTNWPDYALYIRSVGTCGAIGNEYNVGWQYDANTKELTIGGSGKMADYSSAKDQPWYKVCNEITSVIIEPDVPNIGEYAFYQCSQLSSVNIISSVETVGDYAFYKCTNLAAITIPASMSSIGVRAFKASGLTSATIAGNPKIGEDVFPDATTVMLNLTANKVGEDYWMTFYNDYANFQADNLTTVYKATVSGSDMILTPVEDRIVNAGTAVILKSTGNPVMTRTSSDSHDGNSNVLSGTMEDMATPANCYTLANGSSGVGFYHYTGTTLAPGKAYYQGDAGARAFFGFDGETTAMEEVRWKMEDVRSKMEEGRGDWYTLDGRKLQGEPSQKGVYVRNGQKFIIK